MHNGRSIGIPLKEYADSAYEKLAEGKEDQIIVHAMVPGANQIAKLQRENFASLVEVMGGRKKE